MIPVTFWSFPLCGSGQTREDGLGEAEQQREGAVPGGRGGEGQTAEPFAGDRAGDERAPGQVPGCSGAAPSEGGGTYSSFIAWKCAV